MKKFAYLFSAVAALFLLTNYASLPKGYQVGDKVADFKLKNVDGKSTSLADYSSGKGVIVIFTCNTCPVAKAYESRIIELHKQFADRGYPVVAINSNDPGVSPGDSYPKMQERSKDKNYPFAYLFDETQEIAQAYGATNTPTVFVLQKKGSDFTVAYIGAIDNNTEDATQASKKYVEDALNDLLADKPVVNSKTRAIGCTIKWKRA